MSKDHKDKPPAEVFQPEPWSQDRLPAAVLQPEPNRPRLLYKSSEAKPAIDVGETKFWGLVNDGLLDARRIGRRAYVTAESLEAYVAALPRCITPTMARRAEQSTAAYPAIEPAQ